MALLPIAAFLVAGCGGNGTSPSTANPSSTTTGAAFVIGTDAPVAAVTSFTVQVLSIEAVDANGKKVALLSGSPSIDFARYNGLQTLLDLNDVPVGTYATVNVTLGSATIGFLSTQAGSAPAIQIMPAVLAQSTVQVTLPTPLVVSHSEPVGLRVDLDLRKSVQVDSNGQVTGQVTPTFDITAVTSSDPGGNIDEFDAAVVSVNMAGQSFVVQGPHGRQFTVLVTGQTDFEDSESLGQLTNSSIVQISGTIDRAASTIDADEVAILSQEGFFAAGQVTDVQPSSGVATGFDLYVCGLLPTTTGLTLGQIAHVTLTGNEQYFVYRMHNHFTQFLFSSDSLLAGQHVSIGGPASGAANPQAVTTKRVVLHHWGFNGTVVPGSVDLGGETFKMKVTGFAGQLVPGIVTVYMADKTEFRNGPKSGADLAGLTTVRAVGLLIKAPSTGEPVLLARYVDQLK